jgi:hypothetical protein
MVGWWLALLGCSQVRPAEEAPVLADVVDVRSSGSAGALTVSVTVRSPDTGCDRYADWWEIVTADGQLVHRRILNHSHVDEQPFTRSSEGPVDLDLDEPVVVRAHLHPDGYGGIQFRGTFADGLASDGADATFAADLEGSQPLPDDCWF